MNHLSKLGLVIFFTASSLLPSCGSGTKKVLTSNETIKAYQQYILTLDSSTPIAVTMAMKNYRTMFVHQTAETADRGFVIFDTFYGKVNSFLDVQLGQDTTHFDSVFVLGLKPNSESFTPKIRLYHKMLVDNGFEIATTEGIAYIKKDRTFLKKWFYRYLSPPMIAYLEQIRREDIEGFSEDGGVIIEGTVWVDRLIWWELFINKHPNFLLIDDARNHFEGLLGFFCFRYGQLAYLGEWQAKSLLSISLCLSEQQISQV